jgi:hypothetical protein
MSNAMGWISVKERLPEDYVKVLTCDVRGNMHVMTHYHGYKKPFCIERNNARYFMVRYWMPLPEPPQNVRGKQHETPSEHPREMERR